MYLGNLQYLVQLQKPTAAPANQYGEVQESFTTVGSVWAAWNYATGIEQYLADEKTTIQNVLFTIRWRPDVNTLWRLRYKGATYQINAVAELGRRQGLILTSQSRGQEFTI